MNWVIRPIKALELGTTISMFSRYKDGTRRPRWKWAGSPLPKILTIQGHFPGGVECTGGVLLHEDMLIRCPV